jgi:hypothetical protein
MTFQFERVTLFASVKEVSCFRLASLVTPRAAPCETALGSSLKGDKD